MAKDSQMNHVERFNAVMNFKPVDRLPRVEWATWWNKTVERWRGEGMPDFHRYQMYEHFGLDPYFQRWIGARSTTLPKPAHHGAPIMAGMDDYLALLPHLYQNPTGDDSMLAHYAKLQNQGDAVVWITLDGFFWHPRGLLGIEEHFYAFYDKPELMHRINQDQADFQLRMIRWIQKFCKPCFITIAEDMSYNHGPMLSKALFDEFLAPYYRQVVPAMKEMGSSIIVDSDGDVTELMPWLLGVGVDGILPLERQAGCDAMKLRQAMPTLRMIGHFDKMVMDKGEAAIRGEFERLLPVMRTGGFIPSVDHQTPPAVSMEQYRVYMRLLKEYTELAAK